VTLDDPNWAWPVPIAADGRRPTISDGFHEAGDPTVRNGAGHRGQDVMYRKAWPSAPKHPWSSRWYEMLPRTPAIAARSGEVFRCGRLSTGWHVILDHGEGIGTAYHHLSELVAGIEHGSFVHTASPLGVIGGSPVGYGLVHLHFDVAIGGRFIDAGKLMRRWGYVTLEQAWAGVGRV
jgi:murein DD-endopeptidase MepM/ murein hydrolase activator NlpD